MSSQNNILFIYPHSDPLNPAGSGGQNRLYNLVTRISERYNILILGPEDETSTSDTIEYQTYRKITPGFLSDVDYSLAKNLQRIVRSMDPDIIHIPYPSGLVLSELVSRFSGSSARIVLDAHDVMSERAREFDNQNLSAISKILREVYVPTLESVAARIADHIITVSKKDAKLMEQLNGIPHNKITVVPNGADPIEESELASQRAVSKDLGLDSETTAIVFHGNYKTGSHNCEAAERIIDRIAPRFQDRDNVQFFIIGNGAPETELSNVTSLGFVDDLYSTLNSMDIAIVPLTSGTATKLKMFDYMSVGVPIVSTEKGTEGIALQDGKDVIISDVSTNQFVEEIQRLLNDKDRQEQIGSNGRRLVEEQYNWKAIGERLEDIYTELRAGQ